MRAFVRTGVFVILASLGLNGPSKAGERVFPGDHWREKSPTELGLDADKLEELARRLGGRGCVIKDGWLVKQWGSQSERRDWASSAKPVLSTLLFFAIAEGKLSGVDAKVADQGVKLSPKDRSMTFAHLANMISGYARPEPPGQAWAYNDFAIMLYQSTLFDRVFREDPDRLSADRFAPLKLEDGLLWEPKRRRLRASVRDFARLAWFWMNKGEWNGQPVLPRHFFDDYQRPHVPADIPLSQGQGDDDYLHIGTYGGGSNHFSDGGPGIYGFNWWFNGPVRSENGRLTWPDAPVDTIMSIGADGNCAVMIPSRNLLLVAASANWGQHEPGKPDAVPNQRIRLLLEADRGVVPPGKPAMPVEIRGEAKRWHPLTLTFQGPSTREDAEPNPFRDYRLTVRFDQGGRELVVPGFFAADGQAAQTSATAGDRWQVRFLPTTEGFWSYHAELVQGPNVALDDRTRGHLVGVADGSFQVGPTDKTHPDARAAGLLRDVGGRYFVFEGSGQPFLKGGADSPENLLAFADFDGTRPTHRFEPHAGDARPGDPTWQHGKGKNLIGALNYLASKGVNCIYFLTMNIKGDGKDVWPFTSDREQDRDRYDVSKLDQWEIVFNHMDRLGILLHVVHQEQENDQLLDGGELGPTRRLYYRELIARFGHHPALVWNLGEENTNTTEQLKSFARYIKSLDPYDHPIVVHTFPNQYDKVYGPLLGDRAISGLSLQVGNMERCAEITATWLARSAQAGRPWACFLDEIGPARDGVLPDSEDPEHNGVRRHALWAPLMVGGSGSEWLFGVGHPHGDTTLEDFRSRDRMWDQTRWAIAFFQRYVPVRETQPSPERVTARRAFCLAKPGELYVMYLPEGGSARLKLDDDQPYHVDWYNPRAGGALLKGSVERIRGPGAIDLGQPPAEPDRDWAILVRRGDQIKP